MVTLEGETGLDLATMDTDGTITWTYSAPETYAPYPYGVFRRIKSRGGNRRFLAILREAAAWREKEAKRRGTPGSGGALATIFKQ